MGTGRIGATWTLWLAGTWIALVFGCASVGDAPRSPDASDLPHTPPGGMIVTFEQHFVSGDFAGDIDIGAQRIGADGTRLWHEDGGGARPVSDSTRTLERTPTIVTDGAGGAIVSFEVQMREGELVGNTVVMAHRLSAAGEHVWGPSAKFVSIHKWSARPLSVSDGRGGALVVFETHVPDGRYAGDVDLRVQRIGPKGDVLWDEAQPVSVTRARERAAAVVSDGEGGVIVAYEAEIDGKQMIWSQRIGPDGRRLWNDEEHVVVAATKWWARSPVLVADGEGGAFVAFELHSQQGDDADDIDVAGQHLRADGTMSWDDGKSVKIFGGARLLETDPAAVLDGDGGLIVAFAASRSGDEDADILAQRIGPDGSRLWGDEGERSIVVSSGQHREANPHLVRDGDGGAVAVFDLHILSGQYLGDVDVLAQRISADGSLLWNEGDSSSLLSASEEHSRIAEVLPDGRGGAVVLYEYEWIAGEHAGDIDVRTRAISIDGITTDAKGLASGSALERNPRAVALGDASR